MQRSSRSQDLPAMLSRLRASWQGKPGELDRLLRRYYVSCCRRIWDLLPMEESRRCVEVAERHLKGDATDAQLRAAEYHAEGAAPLFLDGFEDLGPERVAKCIAEVEAIPSARLRALLGPAYPTAWSSTRDMLGQAAYLVVLAACYPNVSPIDSIELNYVNFLSDGILSTIAGATIRRDE
jgi:hypothetical protein